CKHQPAASVLEAWSCGVRDFGENRAQELRSHAEDLPSISDSQVRWHFIGTLQSNKVNTVLPYRPWIHTIDRLSLAQAISQRAAAEGVDCLVQVNIGREPQKGGINPDDSIEFARSVARLPGLRLRGLMAVPPANEDPTPHFESMSTLFEALRHTPEGKNVCALSMGMSRDFEAAIRCGATLVRVGTNLFGSRPETSLDALRQ
ncbi:MAG: YggS family pyridoxal phosphate-dependent enzyme, partial [Planctomycetales bacterium]|nr:YggS family pyridoxal phosphate-dependent enzyme [Planctomycetales bacterium]